MNDLIRAGASIAQRCEAIRDTALFYPCCGQDLTVPIKLFAPMVSDFYFVDLRMPRRPDLADLAQARVPRPEGRRSELYVHAETKREFRVHRLQRDAREILDELPKLGVFFFRGDNPVQGEGSSGVLWLGRELFSRVLDLLVPGGLVVTDGSNPGPGGPEPLSTFYHNREAGPAAVEKVAPFEYGGRHLTCIGYAGEKNGPTLIWQVD